MGAHRDAGVGRSTRHDLLHQIAETGCGVESERNLNQDIAVVERVIFYDPQTGEIVGSHSFGSSGAISEAARERFESLIRTQLEALEKQHSRQLAVLRST